jgi:RNA 2',3'-cyclic 3'-phosphodiesterase
VAGVAKERLKSPRARLFVALDLPEPLRAGIVSWGRSELSDPALRVVGPESLHITLAFLGYLPEKEIEGLTKIVTSLTRPAPVIALGDPVVRPTAKRARLFALPVRSPGVVALQAELEEALVAESLYEPEKRPFWPHITVARVKSKGRNSTETKPVLKLPSQISATLRRPQRSDRCSLYRSELKPQGAQYTPLARVELS